MDYLKKYNINAEIICFADDIIIYYYSMKKILKTYNISVRLQICPLSTVKKSEIKNELHGPFFN